MQKYAKKIAKAFTCTLLLAPLWALAFDSGSTGADGAFSPTVNTVLELPPSGILNYTSVTIPAGVTVTFKKNATNTPVVILASGNITLAGVININGGSSTTVGAAGDGNIGNDGLPGTGGPGGFDGGQGGRPNYAWGGPGLGPGGGGTWGGSHYNFGIGGGGGGFAANGAPNKCITSYGCLKDGIAGVGGATYGSSLLLPLIGGSGGGGGGGGLNFGGSGGGGGGGAILLAASGTVTITGSLLANGGASGDSSGDQSGPSGGGGSGGAIRIIARTLAGNGAISAIGGLAGAVSVSDLSKGGDGAIGRIRLEADIITRTAATTPVFTTAAPGTVFVAGLPSLVIVSVAGVAAPASPTGKADIILPATTANPVTVVIKTNNVPVGNTVKLTLVGVAGNATTAVSPALSGSTAEATASVNIALPVGPSTLQAQTTYTIVAAVGDLMRNFADNERVDRIELVAGMDGSSHTNLITVSGKRFEATPQALAALGKATASLMAQGS